MAASFSLFSARRNRSKGEGEEKKGKEESAPVRFLPKSMGVMIIVSIDFGLLKMKLAVKKSLKTKLKRRGAL